MKSVSNITTDLKEKIIRARLSRKEGKIAEYILDNIFEVSFMTTSGLAKKLDTSNTSVNRTTKALGYGTFLNLQKELQKHMTMQASNSNNLFPPPSQRILYAKKDDIQQEFLLEMYDNTLDMMTQTVQKNSVEKIDEVVEILVSSKNKYISGYRGTADIANKLTYLLELVCSNVFSISGEPVSAMSKAFDITPEDCIVIVSFNRYYEIALDVMEMCRKHEAKIILITDHLTAPITHLADVVLLAEVKSLSFFNSNVAAMFLIEVICAKLVRRLEEKAEQRLNAMEVYMRKSQIT